MNIFQSLIDHLDEKQFIRSPSTRTTHDDLDFAQALSDAFSEPLDYPTFEQSIFPGDQLAIVIQAGLPAAGAVLDQTLIQLEKMEFSLDDLVVVISQQSAAEFGFSSAEISESVSSNAENPTPNLSKPINGRNVWFHIHNHHNQAELAYIAANESGEPIYLSRRLVDADVILPIGFCTAADEDFGENCLYPEFSSIDTKRRFQQGDLSSSQMRDEVRLANDTAGTFSAVQIINGPGNSIENVIFGDRNEVLKQSQEQTNKLWHVDIPQKVDAVVATVETTVGKTSWDDFLRAVIVANRLAAKETPIIVWTQLDHTPKGNMRKAMLAQFGSAVRNLSPEHKQLSEILREHPIYLHSNLTADDVEELGLGCIENAAQVNRICSGFETCLLLRDAHKCSVEDTGRVSVM